MRHAASLSLSPTSRWSIIRLFEWKTHGLVRDNLAHPTLGPGLFENDFHSCSEFPLFLPTSLNSMHFSSQIRFRFPHPQPSHYSTHGTTWVSQVGMRAEFASGGNTVSVLPTAPGTHHPHTCWWWPATAPVTCCLTKGLIGNSRAFPPQGAPLQWHINSLVPLPLRWDDSEACPTQVLRGPSGIESQRPSVTTGSLRHPKMATSLLSSCCCLGSPPK